MVRWEGTTGAGEPPTPGRSNRMMVRRGSSASTNGWSTSRLAPMPVHSSSGGQSRVPSRTETRMARPPTVKILIRWGGFWGPARRSRPRTRSMVIDIGSGRVADRRQPAAAQFPGGGLLLAAAIGQPVRVVGPPGSVARLRTTQPLLGVLRGLLGQLVPGLLVARRVDHRGDVPAGGQHEPGAAAEQLGGPVAALPGADVIGDPGDDVGVPVDRPQVHW